MQGTEYHERIRACRSADLDAFVPWYAAGAAVGRVHRDRVALLREVPEFSHHGGSPHLAGHDFATRSRAMMATVNWLGSRGELRTPLDEMYPVSPARGHEPLLQIDRAAVTWFGVRAEGVHLNGFVQDRGIHSWIAERSRDKRTFPGHLDNMVAGGQPIGLSARATLAKECAEEAAIPAELSARARFVGSIDYEQQDGLSMKVDSLACYDLELPPSFVPTAHDGEVERFERMPVAAVAESLRGGSLWKPNSALVALHFLLRFGLLDGELAAPDRWRLWRRLNGEIP